MHIRLVTSLAVATLIGGGKLEAQAGERCATPRAACAFLDTFIAAFNRRDWPAFKATLDPDVTVIFDRPGPPLRQDGHEAVESVFKRIFPDAPVVGGAPLSQIRPQQLHVQDFGEVVIVSFHLPDSSAVGRRTLVLRRAAGKWKVVHIHGSSSAASRE